MSERTSRSPVRWMTAFIDRPAEMFELSTEFWLAVTGTQRSSPRGEHGQFATLVPPDGDAHLRVQRLDDGPAQLHLDLHVDEPGPFADRAVQLGAAIDSANDDVVTLRSPGGLPWCAVAHHGETRAPLPTVLADGTRIAVQQVCIDTASEAEVAERTFWAELTGWPARPGARPEYSALEVPLTLPLRMLFQRIDDPHVGRNVDAHLDVFCSDTDAAAAHQELLGARVVDRFPFWIVMRDPSGEPYCLIQRQP